MFTLLRTVAVRPRFVGLRRCFTGSLVFALAAAFSLAGGCLVSAWAATTTTTALTVTSGGSAVTSVAAGSKVILTATVTANGTALTTGLVNFCDAAATYCSDIHILGSAQLTSAGTAVVNLRPGIGTHSYKAVFAGTTAYAKSLSSSSTLTVTGTSPSTTTLNASGSAGSYTLSATVNGTGSAAPTGLVSFLDTSNGNSVLGSASLGAGASTLSLTSPANQTQQLTAGSFALGDFNGDGWPDLAALNGQIVTILLGNGDGTFVAQPPIALPNAAGAIAVGDFNGDGKADFVVAQEYYTVYLGNGDGSFTARPSVSVPGPLEFGYLQQGEGVQKIAVGDFNNDGKADLIMGGVLALELLGAGDGTFSSPKTIASSVSYHGTYDTYSIYYYIAAADFNNDGNLDLLMYGGYTADSLLLGKGDGTFQSVTGGPAASDTGADYFHGPVVGDFNNDGVPDIAVEYKCNALQVYFGSASSPLSTSATIAVDSTITACSTGSTSRITTLTAGDFTHDGAIDLLWSQSYSGGRLALVPGPFGSSQPPSYYLPLNLPSSTGDPVSADFNGDGLPDVAIPDASGNFPVYLTKQTWTAAATLTAVAVSSSGAHLAEASYPGDANYSGSVSGLVSLTATNSSTLLLTASPSTIGYGQQMMLTASLSPYNVQGKSTDGELITFSRNGSVLGTAPLATGVATYSTTSLPLGSGTLTASFASDGSSPAATSNSVPYTVTQATPVISWQTGTGSIYTGKAVGSNFLNAQTTTAGNFTYTITPAGGSPTTLTATTILAAGSYTLTATFTPNDTTNYQTATLALAYVVNPAALTITPVSASRLYGTANPAFSESLSGALNSDTFTVTASTTATTSSSVGTYPITYAVTGSNISNYTVTPVTGTLTITQVTTVIAWQQPAPITYGTPLSSTQLNATSNAPGTFTYLPPAGTVLQAYTQNLQARFTLTDTTNYSTPPAGGVLILGLQVNKAPLVLTTANATRAYGAANPTFTGTITGVVNNDPIVESFSTIANYTSPVGTYPIVPGPSASSALNYSITATNGTLTITQAGTKTGVAVSNLTVTATVASLTSGTPTGTVQFFNNGSLLGTGTVLNGVAGFTLSSAPVNGDVLSTQYSGDTNFTTSTGSLTVGLLQGNIAWASPAAITYGTPLSAAQLNATSTVPGTFSYSPSVGAVLSAGPQTLMATFTPTDPTRYSSSTAAVALVVTKAPLTLSTNNNARVYGAANPTFTGGITGAVNGDTFTESFSTIATAASPVGSYAIVPSVTGAALANYGVTPTSGVLTISQAGTATTFGLSNSNTTLTATVLALTSGVPSGSVGFYVNQVLVGTGTLSNGTATYTTSSAPPANAVISAQYSGDVNFTQSTSQPILLLSMQPASSALTVSTAGSVTDAITLSAVAGFTGSLTLSCNGLPQGATCSFSPASLTFSGSSTTASSNMTIHTGGTGTNIMPRFPGSLVIPGSPLERNATLLAMISFPGLFAMAFLRRKKRPVMQSLLVLLLFSGIAVSLTACGGSPASSATSGGGTKTVTGTSSVTVLATGSNGFSQSTAVTLTVQ